MRRVAVVLLAAALTGCGASASEEAAEVASAWLDELHGGDYEAACERMVPASVGQMRSRYLKGQRLSSCPAVLRAYRKAVGTAKLGVIRAAGLEPEPPIKENRIGVFPRGPRYQFDVLLMQRSGDDWRVVSVGIPPDG